MSRQQVAPAAVFVPDIFEYVYLAWLDSVIDGISMYCSWMVMGNALAREVQRMLTEKGISVDIVIPVPNTSCITVLNLAQALGLPYHKGFVKNQYVGHTFILPDQQMRYIACYCSLGMAFYATWLLFLYRKKSLQKKLNAMALKFMDKNVLIIDGKHVCTPFYNFVEQLFQIRLCMVQCCERSPRWRKMWEWKKLHCYLTFFHLFPRIFGWHPADRLASWQCHGPELGWRPLLLTVLALMLEAVMFKFDKLDLEWVLFWLAPLLLVSMLILTVLRSLVLSVSGVKGGLRGMMKGHTISNTISNANTNANSNASNLGHSSHNWPCCHLNPT